MKKRNPDFYNPKVSTVSVWAGIFQSVFFMYVFCRVRDWCISFCSLICHVLFSFLDLPYTLRRLPCLSLTLSGGKGCWCGVFSLPGLRKERRTSLPNLWPLAPALDSSYTLLTAPAFATIYKPLAGAILNLERFILKTSVDIIYDHLKNVSASSTEVFEESLYYVPRCPYLRFSW